MPKSKSPGASAPKLRSQAQNKSKPSKPIMLAQPIAGEGTLPRSFRASHREYVSAITCTAGTGFTLLGRSVGVPGYDINPGNSLLFPWLSRIATGFEKYRFDSLVFELVPRNAATVGGVVYMAVDYDWDDPVPIDAAQLMANTGSKSSDPWSVLTIRVDAKRLNQDMPYRYVECVSRSDVTQRMVYGGYLVVAGAGFSSAVAFDLFVSYTVNLTLPAIHTQGGETLQILTTFTIPMNQKTPLPAVPIIPGIRAGKIGVDFPVSIGARNSAWAYQVPARPGGMLEIRADLATAAATPSSFSGDTYVDYEVYDAAGNAIGQDVAFAQGSGTWENLAGLAAWTTNGDFGKCVARVLMDRLKAAYPAAAYLIPIIYSVAGRVVLDNNRWVGKYVEL